MLLVYIDKETTKDHVIFYLEKKENKDIIKEIAFPDLPEIEENEESFPFVFSLEFN